MFATLRRTLKSHSQAHAERGVITMAETLIVLGVAAFAVMIWATTKLSQLDAEAAQLAGRNIAAYSRAAAEWLTENPPAADGSFTITSLQDCADPAGARFLPCSFSADTLIPHVFNATGDPATFDDLIIVVDVLPAGANATIDFGVFRGGEDENGDGLADSRPDLAAIAFREASEETGAGVMNFFRLQFARDDLTGLVTDPDDPAFDLVEWDSLSRLEAQVGAQVDAPFLLVDGGNEMNAGLTFNNGMQLNMDADGLSFQGPGAVDVETLVAAEVQADQLSAENSDLTSSDIDTLTVNPADGVRGAGFDRLDQSADITRIDAEIADHDTRITANLNSITANTAAIAVNISDIATNRNNITANRNSIAANRARLSTVEALNSAQSTRLNRHESRIGALERRPINPPVTTCSPTHNQLVATMGALGWNHGAISFNCEDCRVTRTTRVYQTRNTATLRCKNNVHVFEKFIGSCPEPNCNK